MTATKTIHNILALDAGERRVGIAIANSLARLPSPLTTLERDSDFWDNLQSLVKTESIGLLVVGLPRNLDGNDTSQTRSSRKFAEEAAQRLGLKVELQDEAATSKLAEAELNRRGKRFEKAEVDALAAMFILEDYLNTRGGNL
jgi:putative Holliday junction resolvase